MSNVKMAVEVCGMESAAAAARRKARHSRAFSIYEIYGSLSYQHAGEVLDEPHEQ